MLQSGRDVDHSSRDGRSAGQRRSTAGVASLVNHAIRYRAPFGSSAGSLLVGLACALGLAIAPAHASPATAVSRARSAICAPGVSKALRETALLDAVAQRLARGESLHNALNLLPAHPELATSMHFGGLDDDRSIATAVAGRFCNDLSDPRLSEIGVARSGRQLWVVVIAPLDIPAPGADAVVAREVLARVNAARAAGHRCGGHPFPPVGKLSLVEGLSRTAREHSLDMTHTAGIDHRGRDGSSPADRVRRSGYAAQLVGENVAGGVPNAAAVVDGWLDSPGHCTNIMDGRFTEMGLGYAVDVASPLQIYWTQLFAAPQRRAAAAALR